MPTLTTIRPLWNSTANREQSEANTWVAEDKSLFSESRVRRKDKHELGRDDDDTVDSILWHDPAGIVPLLGGETHARYRRAVEELARRSATTEIEIARRAVRIASAWEGTDHEPSDFRQRHVGYYLIDRGREPLEETIGYVPTGRERFFRFLLRHATSS